MQFDLLISFLVRQNWSTGILRDELELLDALSKSNVWWIQLDRSMYLDSCSFVLVEGRLPKKIYVINTETQREFNNPKLRSIHHLKHIEENRKGRYAYTPNRVAPRGAGKLFEWYETLFVRFFSSSSARIEWSSLSWSHSTFYSAQNAVLIEFFWYLFLFICSEGRRGREVKGKGISLRKPLNAWVNSAERTIWVWNRDHLWLRHHGLKTAASSNAQRSLNHLTAW